MKRTWTTEQIALLKEKYPTCTPAELSVLFPDKTPVAVRTKARVFKLKKAKQCAYLTPEQIEYLKANFHNTQNKDLAERLGCSIHTVESRGFKFMLKKDPEFIAEISRKNMARPDHPGRASQFKKGNVSANKGKKQSEYMTSEAIERTKATRFKKGQLPHNAREVGFERVDKDGYIYVKVPGARKLVLKHRHVWEQAHGAIPAGHNVQFRDGNRHNCNLENLYLISRTEQLRDENSLHARYPEDVRKLIQMKGALSRQINKINKK